MHTVGSSPRHFPGRVTSTADRRERELALRESELERREAALGTARAPSLDRVQATYFAPGQNVREDDWWAMQLGRR
jgi:hypothetical protein